MKVESPEFTEEQVRTFVTDYLELEKTNLVARLRSIVDSLDSVRDSISSDAADGDAWNPIETLAHMVTSSQYFGWLAYRIVTKDKDVGDILEMIKMRDVVTAQAAEQSVESLVDQLKRNVERTAAFIEKVPANELRQRFDYVGIDLTVEDLLRLPLCAHLESHLEQVRGS